MAKVLSRHFQQRPGQRLVVDLRQHDPIDDDPSPANDLGGLWLPDAESVLGEPVGKAADKLARQSASRPFRTTRVPPSVRRKTTPKLTQPGSVGMDGQRLTIRIIQAEHLPTHRLYRYRYEVISRRSQFRGCVDFAFSDNPLMRPGHTYFVTMGREQGNPRIVKCHRERTARGADALRSAASADE